jgi:hypothetical protein
MNSHWQLVVNVVRQDRISSIYWMALTLLLVAADYFGGGKLQFPVLFLFPIALASWYGGRVWGLSLAGGLPLIGLAFWPITNPPWPFLDAVANTVIREIVFLPFSFAVNLASTTTREVRTLPGLLPIRAWCKKVRDDEGYWSQIDFYLESHSEMHFTHGICPDCIDKYHHGVKPPLKS